MGRTWRAQCHFFVPLHPSTNRKFVSFATTSPYHRRIGIYLVTICSGATRTSLSLFSRATVSSCNKGSAEMATKQPEGANLERTPEIRETASGNVEVRKDPDHVNRMSKPEQVLGSKGTAKTASQPEDILAFQRTVGDTDTPLE